MEDTDTTEFDSTASSDGFNDSGNGEPPTSPPLSDFDPWKIGQPEDGVVWLYRSDVDDSWRIILNEDHALAEATGYPVGELVTQEVEMDNHTNSERGELRAIFVPPKEETDPHPDAVMGVRNARAMIDDFEDLSIEERHGAIKHAMEELRNARRALPDDY